MLVLHVNIKLVLRSTQKKNAEGKRLFYSASIIGNNVFLLKIMLIKEVAIRAAIQLKINSPILKQTFIISDLKMCNWRKQNRST